MAITPRMIFTQPAPAAVATVALVGMSILGSALLDEMRLQSATEIANPCEAMERDLGPQQHWTEGEWLRTVACYDARNRHLEAATAADEGLRYYPRSESLYNAKGYHLIELRQFPRAVVTLETARNLMVPSDGVMENNLAWAYLFVGKGYAPRTRALYQAALEKEPNSCETIHTGLMVEFETARRSVGIARAEALKSFQSLRTRYNECENRNQSWSVAVEAVGAGVLYMEVEKMLGSDADASRPSATLVRASQTFGDVLDADAEGMCVEAMPMVDLHRTCVRAIRSARNVER